METASLKPLSFDSIKGWAQDDHAQAFAAFLRSARRMAQKPYKTRALGEDGTALAAIGEKALAADNTSASDAKVFFERHFQPHHVMPQQDAAAGFMTGFFEPEMQASLQQSEAFPEPLYARPPELVDLNDDNRPPELDETYRYGWLANGKIVQSPDRGAINAGALAELGLEIAWMRNRVDAFFIHVQGAAKLMLPDGESLRVTYAGKTGHPYTSLGRLLCERLGVTTAQMTSDVLRDWMMENPAQLDEVLAHNRSYIFFEASEAGEVDGPIAAAKVPLMPHRSLAVDRSLHTFGVPFFISTHTPLPGETTPFRKLMIAHDTGSAIVGPARGDIFCGTGDAAGMQAGRIQHAADMIVLMPKALTV
ncbi:murein transglycosylase A [Pseudahrensia aquimaris]|uniref:peptidoglycan lytic exotransglycosylase n=1 Tax=Pseudahrensia aquimaris TaxID=744461 RepID=A0ABW3FHP1_9HYPH